MAFTKVLPAGISSSLNFVVDSINSVGVITASGIAANTGTFTGGSVGIATTTARATFQVGSGTSTFAITGIGSVGIGTTVPQAKLHVLGDSIITRVGVATTSANTNLELGRTYIYYSGVTLTLPASPTSGDRVEVINRSNTTTAILARNGSNIMGLAEDLDLDVLDGAFTITYSNATDGWVIGR